MGKTSKNDITLYNMISLFKAAFQYKMSHSVESPFNSLIKPKGYSVKGTCMEFSWGHFQKVTTRHPQKKLSIDDIIVIRYHCLMIKNFNCKDTEKLFNRKFIKKLPTNI